MIDEKKLIEILKERENMLEPHAFQHGTESGHIINDEEAFGRYSEIGIIRQTVKRLAEGKDTKVTANSGWIPASERLPKKPGEYIVMIEDAVYPTVLIYSIGEWCDEYLNYYKVLAWQPLPEPYRAPVAEPAMTNADRIRNMTDEELAKFIHAVGCNSHYGDDCGFPFCHSMKGNLCHGIKDNTDARTLKWLKSEVVKE